MDRTVICMKWGTLYSGAYVNVLFNACRANITGDFTFVCLTDDPTGLDPAIKHYPIPNLNLAPEHWKKGCWAKLSVFSSDLYGLTGRALFIDLDMVICQSLDDFFIYEADKIVAIDTGPTWGNQTSDGMPMAGTGIFAFDLGKHDHIVERFAINRQQIVDDLVLEQVFVQACEPEMAFWPEDWVLSFKYHLRKPPLLGLLRKPRKPKPNERVIAFHGDPRPIELVQGGLWGIGPHWGIGKVDWMVEYWDRFGGKHV